MIVLFGGLPGSSATVLVAMVLVGLILGVTITFSISMFQSASASSNRYSDFNGDGIDDLAIGIPKEDISKNSIQDGGAVQVIYGTSSVGLSALEDGSSGTGLTNQLWTQNSQDVAGVAIEGEQFGFSVASGDFNRDGLSDLAMGSVDNVVGGISNAGSVNVIYGSGASGLSPTAASIEDQVWHQNTLDIQGISQTGDHFGWDIETGDFNNDGYDDMAVGVPGEPIVTSSGMQLQAGAVNVIYGSSEGLSADTVSADGSGRPDQVWTQNSAGIIGISESLDLFGIALATGDFNDDDYDDLAIGVKGEGFTVGRNGPGAVNIIFGSSSGLSASAVPNEYFQASFESPNSSDIRPLDYGVSLTAGDFNGDGSDDLAIGVPKFMTEGSTFPEAGAVQVIYGATTGLASTLPNQIWNQGVENVVGIPKNQELFGLSTAAADFNNDGYDDLAIGVPGDKVSNGEARGAVNIIYGSAGGLSATDVPDQLITQNSYNVNDVAEANDEFGFSLTSGDYNGDGFSDLAIGSRSEDINNVYVIVDVGAVNVIYGSSNGLSPVPAVDGTGLFDQVWNQNSADIKEIAEQSDSFNVVNHG